MQCLVVGERRSHDIAEYTKLNKLLFRNEGDRSLVDQEQVVDPKGNGSTAGSK